MTLNQSEACIQAHSKRLKSTKSIYIKHLLDKAETNIQIIMLARSYLLLLLFKARALMLRHLIKTPCIQMKVGVAIIRMAHSIVVNIRKWVQPKQTV